MLIGIAVVLVAPPARADIRFYHLNEQGQQYRSEFVRNADKTGCHTFLKKRNVYRVAQVRFAYCEVYSERDCAEDSVLTARWIGKRKKSEDKKKPVTRLTPGAMWALADRANVKVRSWRCEE